MKVMVEVPTSVLIEIAGISCVGPLEMKFRIEQYHETLTPENHRTINSVWRKKFQETKQKGKVKPFAGPIYAFYYMNFIGPIYYVVAKRTTYKRWLGLQNTDQKQYAFGTGAYLITTDKKTCFSVRGSTIDDPGRYSVVGGFVTPKDKLGGKINPLINVITELKEEADIEEKEIISTKFLGLTQADLPRPVCEFQYLVEIALTSQEVEKRFAIAADSHESERRIWLINQPKVIRKFLLNNYQLFRPGDFACAVFAGRHLWGSDWLEIG